MATTSTRAFQKREAVPHHRHTLHIRTCEKSVRISLCLASVCARLSAPPVAALPIAAFTSESFSNSVSISAAACFVCPVAPTFSPPFPEPTPPACSPNPPELVHIFAYCATRTSNSLSSFRASRRSSSQLRERALIPLPCSLARSLCVSRSLALFVLHDLLMDFEYLIALSCWILNTSPLSVAGF